MKITRLQAVYQQERTQSVSAELPAVASEELTAHFIQTQQVCQLKPVWRAEPQSVPATPPSL